jgi:hypothetical protein
MEAEIRARPTYILPKEVICAQNGIAHPDLPEGKAIHHTSLIVYYNALK